MKQILRALVLFFLMVTIPRVAAYSAIFSSVSLFGWDVSRGVAFIFAMGLSITVFVATYIGSLANSKLLELEAEGVYRLSRKKIKELRAKKKLTKAETELLKKNVDYEKVDKAKQGGIVAAIIFTLIEGVFNISEVIPAAIEKGTISSWTAPAGWPLVSTWIFAAVPTIAVLVLAWNIALFDRAGELLEADIGDLFEDLTGLENKKKVKKPSSKKTRVRLNLPAVEHEVIKHPEVEALRSSKEKLTGKDHFIAVMYNRQITDIDIEHQAKAYNVSKNTVESWVREIEKKRKEAEDLNAKSRQTPGSFKR